VPGNKTLDTRCCINWSHPLNAGLVGRWQAIPGWTGGDKLRDLTRRGNDGTLTNMAIPATSTSGWQTAGGRPGGCGFLALDGSDDYVSVADAPAINFGAGDFTIAVWAKLAAVNRYILSHQKATSPYTGYGLYVGTSGLLAMETSDGTFASFSAACDLTDGKWRHVAVTRVGASIALYQDGSLLSSGSGRAGDLTQAVGLRIGTFSDGSQPWLGGLDEIRFLGRALSGSEAAALYEDSLRGSPGTLRWLSSRAYFLPAAAGGGGVIADLSVTLAGPTLSASAAVAVAASATPTLAAPAISSAGTVSVVAGVSQTLAGPTLSSAASVAVVASLASTLAGVTLSSACTAAVAASATPMLAGPTLDSNIPAPGGVVATADVTLAGPTLSSACAVTVTASAAPALSDPSLSSVCTVSVVASLSVTLAGPTLYARIGDAAAAPVVIRIPISSSRVVRVAISSSHAVRIPISL